ncbi:MAG: FAD-dependent oxidoreductase [Oscillospiraceae bacterium]|nr:FAD-dependent oxidoreductase [Oscillospiraceae bacterium]MBQ6901572.1 FAD-dependent oxidoreductase [Oscillospiraceae bacterium]
MLKKTYSQPAQNLPVLYDVDVLVVGGGTAGSIAAIAAARAGAKTLVIERTASLGGTPVTNLMASCGNRFYSRDGKFILRGLPYELMCRIEKMGGLHLENTDASLRGKMNIPITVPFRSELMSLALREMAREAGAEVLVHTMLSHVIEPGPNPKGVVAVNKGGPFAIFAKEIVDCSGEADVAVACKAPFTSGCHTTSWSLLMRMGNVNAERVMEHIRAYDPDERWPEFGDWLSDHLGMTVEEIQNSHWRKILDPILFAHAPDVTPGANEYCAEKKQYLLERWEREGVLYNCELTLLRREMKAAVEAGDFSLIKKIPGFGIIVPNFDGFAIGAWGEGIALVNISQCMGGFDPNRGEDVSRAEEECRKYNAEIANFLIKYVPGFENAYMLDMGAQTVARHAVMIDGIVKGGFEIVDGKKKPLGDGIYWAGGVANFGEPIPIPYGVCIPKGVDNVFVAGKHASGAPAYRSIPSCMAMGQAMGVAAALCARDGKTNSELDIKLLQDELRKQDVLLDL